MYNPAEVEKKVSSFWEKEKIYEKAKKRNSGKQKFYFNDGPPYATGQIHPGTAWNKCLKDAICRYKRMRGLDVRAQPGFDTHGLPIEVKVEQELKFSSKKDIEKYGVEKFIEKCKAFAVQYIDVMAGQFKSLGVWMDWDSPYITYRDEFIEKAWRTIKKAEEKGLLERGVSVLPYCPRCETTMANYELEYGEQKDPSIYLKFRVKGKEDEYLVVWTTTPWTLAANMAVMAHPEFQYVKAKVDGEKWILARERLDAVAAIANPLGLKVEILEEFSGRKLEGLKYEQPLMKEVPIHSSDEFKKFHYVTLSDEFVTLEEGTGLVHTAPGHGPQDFEIGKREKIPPFCPVDTKGEYTKDAGKYSGMKVFDANKAITHDLKEKGLLLNAGWITHRYPHCWRCKTPLVFITTDQWFIKVTKMRDKMLAEIESCRWQPDHARIWFRDFVTSAPDWCISRQRYWGIPLPIWVCEGCSNQRVFGSRAEVEKLWGHKFPELHKPHIDKAVFKCDRCEGKMYRVPDVLDVWFDSGNAIWASLSEEEFGKWYPCDFITEGKDQIRGWFYSLLGSGIVAYDEIPYKALLMHGHFVDEKGEKMSKSLGNFVPLEDVTGKYGADSFRLWSLNSVIWDDLKFNWEEVKDAHRALGILWNVHIFLQRAAELEGFDPKKPVAEKELDLEDQWLLSRLNTVIRDATDRMEKYEAHEANRLLREFVVSDLSRLYLKLAKKRLSDGRNKHAALKALHDSLLAACRLAAPFAPFIAEEIYQDSFRAHGGAESVSLLEWPEHDPGRINTQLEAQMATAVGIASALASARQDAGVKLRWPLEEAVISTQSTEVRNAVERLPFIIEMLANVKKLRLSEKIPLSVTFTVNFNRLGPAFKGDAQKVGEALKAQNPEKLKEALAGGKFELELEGKKFAVLPEMVEFREAPPEGHALADFSGGKALLKTHINKELYSEGICREVARRIQQMRKEAGLVEKDKIEVDVSAGKDFIQLLEQHRDGLAKGVHASSLTLSHDKKHKGAKKWEIEEEEVEIAVKKA